MTSPVDRASALDGVARALAQPMPRRRALRMVGGALAGLWLGGLRSGTALAGLRDRDCTGQTICVPGNEDCFTVCCPPDRICCTGPPAPGCRACCVTNPHCCDPCSSVCLPDGSCAPAKVDQSKCRQPCPKGKKKCNTSCCEPDEQCIRGKCVPKCDPPKHKCGEKCCEKDEKCMGGECVGTCGPEIGSALADALGRVKQAFSGWSTVQRTARCDTLIGLAPIAWDVVELNKENRTKLNAAYKPCGSCKGSNTVQINGECSYAGSVNYVVYGVMYRLCHDFFAGSTLLKSRARFFDESAMEFSIGVYKTSGFFKGPAANTFPALDWAKAGYRGWPNAPTPVRDRPKCAPCGQTYNGAGFSVQWGGIPGLSEISP